MQLRTVPLLTPLRAALSLAAGALLSWQLHAGIHQAWLTAPHATAGDDWATPTIHWAVAVYSLILTSSLAWLILTAVSVLRESTRPVGVPAVAPSSL